MRFACSVAFLRNITLLLINMKATWQAIFLKSRGQANQCSNFGETDEVCSSRGRNGAFLSIYLNLRRYSSSHVLRKCPRTRGFSSGAITLRPESNPSSICLTFLSDPDSIHSGMRFLNLSRVLIGTCARSKKMKS